MDADITVLSAEPSEAFLEHVADGTMPMVGTLVSAKLDLAYEEVQAKMRRIKDVFRRMDDAGSFRGCAPAGYMITGVKYFKCLVPDPQRQADVVQAFTDATAGTATPELARRLGFRTAEAAARMLRNMIYSTGRYEIRRADGVTVLHRCEPLITPAVQAAAIAALESRLTGDHVSSRAIAKDDFSGALYCPCGASELGMHRYFGGKTTPRADGSIPDRVRRYKCQACGKSVRADDADQAVHGLMAARATPWLDKWLVPGDDHSADLDRVRMEYRELSARGLSFDDEDAERDRLRAEIKRLEALPSNPARTVTGFRRDADGNVLSEADRWNSLDNAARRAWLTSREFRVFVKAAGNRSGRVNAELVYTDSDDS